jgi:hypothetical protein
VSIAESNDTERSRLTLDTSTTAASPYASEAFALAECDPYVRYVHASMLHAYGSNGEAMDALDDLSVEPSLQPWINVARAEFEPSSVDISVLCGIP